MNFEQARENMVEGQVRPASVTRQDLVSAMRDIPREHFVPDPLKEIAYVDDVLELGEKRFMLPPTLQARLIQAADIQVDDLVLEVGCGTGYGTALLARLVNTVVAIDESKIMASMAETLLNTLDICNAAVFQSAHADGFAKQAPYNVILVNGSVPEIPQVITDQLADNGRLVTICAPSRARAMGQAVLVQKWGKTVSSRPLFDAAAPVLNGFEKAEAFQF